MALFTRKPSTQENETIIPVQCPACGKDIEFKFEHHHETTSTSELVFIKEKKKTYTED